MLDLKMPNQTDTADVDSVALKVFLDWIEQQFLRARVSGEIHSANYLITPAIAAYLIEHKNHGNRPLIASKLALYTKNMRNGSWKRTAQGMSFADDERLNDGQHRLHAVRNSGVSIVMHIAFGEPREVFDVLDTGGGRGGKDALAIAGYKNCIPLAAAARIVMAFEEKRHFSNKTVENTEMVAFVRARDPMLPDLVMPGTGVGKKFKVPQAPIVAAFYLIASGTKHGDKLPEFMKRLHDGGGQPRSPILSLRDHMMQRALTPGIDSPAEKVVAQIAAIINAWNLHVTGQKLTALKHLLWAKGADIPTPY